MNCEHIRPLIGAHHDGELDAANTLEVERHLADCPQCFAQLRALGSLRAQFADESLRFRAPSDLRAKIRAAVAAETAAEREPVPTRRNWLPFALPLAAAIVFAALLATQYLPRPREDPLLTELTASHVRSLMATHLMDVASTDQHTVKPWFDGKLDFAPPVKDLRDSGFPLLGGRLDYLDDRPVAALVYARQKHFINLFIWPSAAAPETPKAAVRNGYHLVHWVGQGMTFWAVSDLNEKELTDFAGLWPAG
jgi:anti-sigma factor RsiW